MSTKGCLRGLTRLMEWSNLGVVPASQVTFDELQCNGVHVRSTDGHPVSDRLR